ncbi:hypothetical protein DEJ03_06570 [Curtobacterium sp. MCLR17_043]|nr:hypothetical protein DEJ03_06570 [Curtobacterium sp. MCLR17_043]
MPTDAPEPTDTPEPTDASEPTDAPAPNTAVPPSTVPLSTVTLSTAAHTTDSRTGRAFDRMSPAWAVEPGPGAGVGDPWRGSRASRLGEERAEDGNDRTDVVRRRQCRSASARKPRAVPITPRL